MRSFEIGAVAVICLTSNAFAAEPAPTKFNVDGVEREALVFLPSTSAKTKPPVTSKVTAPADPVRSSTNATAAAVFIMGAPPGARMICPIPIDVKGVLRAVGRGALRAALIYMEAG